MQIAFSKAFSRLLESRPTCLLITGAIGLHGCLLALGLPSWQCPIRHGLGIPCPGCGLSRAMASGLQGDWYQALLIHAFAPVAIAAILLILMSGLLPVGWRGSLVDGVRSLETHTGITFFALTGLIVYWLVRLVFFHDILYRLVM
ncbi:MAG: DUF2752 domain-containing protein [Leptolyngbya sp. SIOISBB]|nr:DUF2752 domain-containing protein [Leptolyngbya sp. SIOISBB]